MHNSNSAPPVAPASTAPDIAGGDHVFFKPRPDGLEVVRLVEYRAGGWWIKTQRERGLCMMMRYARAEDFHLVEGAPAEPVRPGQRLAPLRPLWPVRLAAVATLLASAALWATVSGLAR